MLILITNGTYGHNPILPNGKRSPYVVPVNRKSGPIDVDPEEAARLVEAGVAEYVTDNPVAEPQKADVPVEAEALQTDVPLEEMTFAQLKEIAKGMGIDVGKIKSKAAMIEAISDEAEDGEPLPELDAQDVVD
nr:hypothetical protein [Clostridia bacterium]